MLYVYVEFTHMCSELFTEEDRRLITGQHLGGQNNNWRWFKMPFFFFREAVSWIMYWLKWKPFETLLILLVNFIGHSLLSYRSQKLADDLMRDNMPKKTRKRSESKGYSWFSWRRNNQTQDPEANKDISTDAEKSVLPPSQSKEVSVLNQLINETSKVFSLV